MALKAPTTTVRLTLPVQVVGPVDVGRLARELERLEDSLLQQALRVGQAKIKLPKTSLLMDQLIELNQLDLVRTTHRARLRKFLADILARSPVLHMSFSADPSPAFTEKLMSWLRQEIHPQVLLTVGLQPTIGAGCILRTTNKYFDFSLRQDFVKKRDLLLSGLAKTAPPAREPAS